MVNINLINFGKRKRGSVIHAGVASIPERVNRLYDCIESIYSQVDEVKVYLNGYKKTPKFLDKEKITVYRSQETGDLNDRGKFFSIDKGVFYVSIDDDIVYPENYVETLKKAVDSFPQKCIVGVHGVIYPSFPKNFFDRKVIHYRKSNKYNLPVSLLGTGTTAFYGDDLELTLEDMPLGGMADIWVAIKAKRKKLPMICISRPSEWLENSEASLVSKKPENINLYEKTKEDSSRHTSTLCSASPWGSEDIFSRHDDQAWNNYCTGISFALAMSSNSDAGKKYIHTIREKERIKTLYRKFKNYADLYLSYEDRLKSFLWFYNKLNKTQSVLLEIIDDIEEVSPSTALDKCISQISSGTADRQILKKAISVSLRMQSYDKVIKAIESTYLSKEKLISAYALNAKNHRKTFDLLAELYYEHKRYEEIYEILFIYEEKDVEKSSKLVAIDILLNLETRNNDIAKSKLKVLLLNTKKFDSGVVAWLLKKIMSKERKLTINVADIIQEMEVNIHLYNYKNKKNISKMLKELSPNSELGDGVMSDEIIKNLSERDSILYKSYLASDKSINRCSWMKLFGYDAGGKAENYKSVGHDYSAFYELASDRERPTTCEEKMERGKISVIITTYNAEKTILYAVKSIVNQTYKNIEIICVDDASTDNTIRKLEEISRKYNAIKIIKNPINSGPYHCRNLAIEVASGEFYAIQDADDWSVPERLEKQMDFLSENHHAMGVVGKHIRVDKSGCIRLENNGNILGHGPMTFLYRKEVVEKIGNFLPVSTRGDMEYFNRLKSFYGNSAFAGMDDVLLVALHSVSSNSRVMTDSSERQYRLEKFKETYRIAHHVAGGNSEKIKQVAKIIEYP